MSDDILKLLDAEDDDFGIVPQPSDPEPAQAAYADHLLERIAELDAAIAGTRAAAEIAVKRVADRWEEITSPLAERRRLLTIHLEDVALRLQYPGKKKSRDLGAGTIGWRTKKAHLFVDDAKAALAWVKRIAQPHPALEGVVKVKTSESVDQAKLEAYALATGEQPDGCRFEPERETFQIAPRIDAIATFKPKRLADPGLSESHIDDRGAP